MGEGALHPALANGLLPGTQGRPPPGMPTLRSKMQPASLMWDLNCSSGQQDLKYGYERRSHAPKFT